MKSRALTKADTRALWYAVQCLSLEVRVMHADPANFTQEQLKAEQQRLRAARAALRKVNAIRANGGPGAEAA